MTRACIALALMGCGSDKETWEDVEPGPVCEAAPTAKTQARMGLQAAGLERTFRLTVPAAAAGERLPVLFAFHGGGGSGQPFPDQDEFDETGAIVVYPNGVAIGDNEGDWLLNTENTGNQDVAFVEAILSGLEARYCIDTNRTYATGYSLGSMYTYEVACQLNARFAAVASYAGTMPIDPASCDLASPIAVMHIHGDQDEIISYDSTWDWKAWDAVGPMQDIPSLITYWGNKLNCSEVIQADTSTGEHTVHSACDGDVRVEHHRLADWDHWWPYTIADESAVDVIWGFLSEFSKG